MNEFKEARLAAALANKTSARNLIRIVGKAISNLEIFSEHGVLYQDKATEQPAAAGKLIELIRMLQALLANLPEGREQIRSAEARRKVLGELGLGKRPWHEPQLEEIEYTPELRELYRQTAELPRRRLT
jgi:hypothetical protein